MTFLQTFRTLLLAIALSSALQHAYAQTVGDALYDLQPCPEKLAIRNGAEPSNTWDITLSPYTHHWKSSPEHKPVKLIAINRQLTGGRFCGLALFTNSYGQPSAYGYVGQRWDNIFGVPKLFTKVSAGFIYGYKDKHKDAIAFNDLGIAPAIIPALGYAITPKDSAEVFLLGTAGVTFTYTRGF